MKKDAISDEFLRTQKSFIAKSWEKYNLSLGKPTYATSYVQKIEDIESKFGIELLLDRKRITLPEIFDEPLDLTYKNTEEKSIQTSEAAKPPVKNSPQIKSSPQIKRNLPSFDDFLSSYSNFK